MTFKRINVEEAKSLIRDKQAQIIDIRDEQSYQNGHIPDSILIHNGNMQDFIQSADMDAPLIVCCYHGNMSQSAAAYFADLGFDESCSLDGGYQAWAGDV